MNWKRQPPVTGPVDDQLDLPGFSDVTWIGSGPTGIVYRAFQEGFDRDVAVKLVLADMSGNPDKRWKRASQDALRLSSHPNIVTVLDAGMTLSGRPYLVMDLYPWGSLADRLSGMGSMDALDVLDMGVKLSGVLESAHRIGVVHRDVKPENILLSDFGEPMLADFGVTSVAGSMTESLEEGALTPMHTAPEVLRGARATPVSDVYSLGSVLYNSLAGRPAFQAGVRETMSSLVARVGAQPLSAIRRGDVPDELEVAVRWAMAKAPASRPPSAAALGQNLQQIQVRLGEPPTELRVIDR